MKETSHKHRSIAPFLTRRSFVHHTFAGAAGLSIGQAFGQKNLPKRGLNKRQDDTSDSTIALLREGYLFIPNRCKALNSDIFETKLMSKKVICINGHKAAKLFYNNDLFERKDAAPENVQKSLTGKNGVQSLDGAVHRNRKAMYLSLMGPGKLTEFDKILKTQLNNAAKQWTKEKKITLFDEAQEIFCKAACEWSGVPLKDSEVEKRASDMSKMVNGLGSIGYRNRVGVSARKRSEAWMVDIINQVRTKKLAAPRGRALYTMAWHKDLDGRLLDAQVAAVELLNIIRPITAIATCVTFTAQALQKHPQYRTSLRRGKDADYQAFIQEVRRFYPFTPFVLAKTRKDFTWQGHHFPKGRSVILSIYGVDHDPKLWPEPEKFKPSRFKNRRDDKFAFVPHGGGDPRTGHRCAGEQLTVQAMKVVLNFLVNDIEYSVPPQDMDFALSKIPTLPKSGFVMSKVKLRKSS